MSRSRHLPKFNSEQDNPGCPHLGEAEDSHLRPGSSWYAARRFRIGSDFSLDIIGRKAVANKRSFG
jgi:hypothetical protein